jgi:TonB family protein
MQNRFKCLAVAALLGLVAALAPQARADDSFEYKLFQFHTSSMNSEIDNFATLHPGWELVSMTALDFQDQGTVSILFLGRRRLETPLPPGASIVPAPAQVPVRVEVVSAPQWALESGYAQATVVSINAKLAPSNKTRSIRGSATVDVVMDSQGTVLLADVRSGKVDKSLSDAAVAAIQAASPFGAVPEAVDAAPLLERSFTFRVNP